MTIPNLLPCPTGKRRFSEAAAQTRLADIKSRAKRKSPRKERNAYLCPYCGWWHLTSQSPRSDR